MNSEQEPLILKKLWMEKARKVTLETLMDFYKELQDFEKLKPEDADMGWSYGCVVNAMAAFGVAAMHAFDKGQVGGITGYQASWVMWGVIQGWMQYGDQPLKLLKYEEMLYPQYEYNFNTISTDNWTWLQEQAKLNLQDKQGLACQDVIDHWQSIVEGNVPFGLKVSDS